MNSSRSWAAKHIGKVNGVF